MTRTQGAGLGSQPQTGVRLTQANREWITRYAAEQKISLNLAVNEAVALLRKVHGETTSPGV